MYEVYVTVREVGKERRKVSKLRLIIEHEIDSSFAS